MVGTVGSSLLSVSSSQVKKHNTTGVQNSKQDSVASLGKSDALNPNNSPTSLQKVGSFSSPESLLTVASASSGNKTNNYLNNSSKSEYGESKESFKQSDSDLFVGAKKSGTNTAQDRLKELTDPVTQALKGKEEQVELPTIEKKEKVELSYSNGKSPIDKFQTSSSHTTDPSKKSPVVEDKSSPVTNNRDGVKHDNRVKETSSDDQNKDNNVGREDPIVTAPPSNNKGEDKKEVKEVETYKPPATGAVDDKSKVEVKKDDDNTPKIKDSEETKKADPKDKTDSKDQVEAGHSDKKDKSEDVSNKKSSENHIPKDTSNPKGNTEVKSNENVGKTKETEEKPATVAAKNDKDVFSSEQKKFISKFLDRIENIINRSFERIGVEDSDKDGKFSSSEVKSFIESNSQDNSSNAHRSNRIAQSYLNTQNAISNFRTTFGIEA